MMSIDKRKKVLIVISNLEFGGAQRQIVELVNNIDRTRFELHICSLSNYVPLAKQFIEGTPVHIIHKRSKFDFSVVGKLIILLRKYRFTAVHSFLFDAEIACRLAARLSFLPIKVIGSERNANYTLKKIQKKAHRLTKGMVDLLVANSQSGADYNALQTGIAAHKYRVVYNGVDTDRFCLRDKKEIRKQLDITPDVMLIGMFASFKAQKNHPVLISALQQLKLVNVPFKLLLVGDMLHGGMHGSDHYSDTLKEQIKSSGLQEQVIYLGNQDSVEHIYPACDFTVLPSLFEGTPNVVLESMACGVPVIATRVSDNDRIIQNDFSGSIVEVNDVEQLSAKIKQFIEQPKWLAEIAKNARAEMESRFSSIQLAKNMQKIYAE